MLRTWAVRNFKSIAEMDPLDLAPLTIVAGANNSGKSSLLQSILLISQTLRNTRDAPPLVVEGEFFKGEPREMLHGDAKSLGFAFELDFRLASRTFEGFSSALQVQTEFRLGKFMDSSFEVAQTALSLLGEHDELLSAVRIQRRPRAWTGAQGSQPPSWLKQGAFSYEVVGQNESGAEDVKGVLLSHFLPQYFAVRRDAVPDAFHDAMRILLRMTPSVTSALRSRADLEGQALEVARQLLGEPEIKTLDDIDVRRRNALRPSAGIDKVPKKVRPIFKDYVGDFNWVRRQLPTALENGATYLRSFANSVRYLGPLRLPPQYVYGSAPETDDTSVGSSGQYTAAQLYRHRALRVEYVDPDTDSLVSGTLTEAVRKWLRHMDILQDLDTWYRPKLGHYLWVRSAGVKGYLDLTSVGVGASQVLPVLVQALLAPKGAFLMFEQPELHLHPRVESLLGDFFIGLTRAGKQCLIETHSEHIVDRVRLRIAQAPTNELLNNTAIHFVERRDGKTAFRRLTLGASGAIQDWPDGFFDQSQMEAERLLRASLLKQAGEDTPA